MLMRGGAPTLPLARCGFVSFASWPIASLNRTDTDDFSDRSKRGWAQRLGHLILRPPSRSTRPPTKAHDRDRRRRRRLCRCERGKFQTRISSTSGAPECRYVCPVLCKRILLSPDGRRHGMKRRLLAAIQAPHPLSGHARTWRCETITQLGASSNPNTSRTFARSQRLYTMIFAKS